MNVYVILKNLHNNEDELEKFSDEEWNAKKGIINPDRIQYVTVDVEDEELKRFKTIIWNKVYDVKNRIDKKIIVPFTPQNTNIMQELSDKESDNYIKEGIEYLKVLEKQREEKEKKYKESENFKKFINSKEKNDNLIPEDEDEISAIYKWIELKYIQPAPKRISEIKKSYNMSWNTFIKYIQTNF